jgi:hypothetical protein
MALRIELNRAGVRDILRSPGVLADLERRAQAVAAAAGPGHTVDTGVGPNRARAAVYTDTFEAMWEEARNRNLSRAFGAAR